MITAATSAQSGSRLLHRQRTPPEWAAAAEHVTVLLAALAWLLLVVPSGYIPAGSELPIAVAFLVPALFATRPAQRLPRAALVLAPTLATCATVAMAFDQAGWAHPRFASYFLYSALAGVAVAAYARAPRRQLGTAIAICVCGLFVVLIGVIRWVHGGNPNALLLWPIGWHNQMAAFLLPPAVIGGSLLFATSVPARAAGVTAAALAGAGIVLTTSRAGLALLLMGWLGLGLVALRQPTRRRAVWAWLALPVLVSLSIAFLVSPLFFPHAAYHFPFFGGGAGDGRGLGTAGESTTARATYIRAAVKVWAHDPLVGRGFGSFAPASAPLLPAHWPHYAVVYDVWIDALFSGGLLFALPVLWATVGPTASSLRTAWSRSIPPGVHGVLAAGASAAALLLLGHAAFDVDVDYPSCAGMLGVTIGFAWACTHPDDARLHPSRTNSGLLTACLGLSVAATCAFAALR